ncbi:MAG: 30S ribosomal protein S8 [Methanomicrobiales archaeon]|nr:30S ribosomal protein S8 [Methanomicrobiales archaeon]
MARLNPIADAMSALKNAADTGKEQVTLEPASKLLGAMLGILKDSAYISGFEMIDDGRGGHFIVRLNGRINQCGAINPRFNLSVDEMEGWETRYLPAKNFGILLMTTSQGVMSHLRARELRIGGELLAFVY